MKQSVYTSGAGNHANTRVQSACKEHADILTPHTQSAAATQAGTADDASGFVPKNARRADCKSGKRPTMCGRSKRYVEAKAPASRQAAAADRNALGVTPSANVPSAPVATTPARSTLSLYHYEPYDDTNECGRSVAHEQ